MRTEEGDNQFYFFCFTSLLVAVFFLIMFSLKELSFFGGGVPVCMLNPGGKPIFEELFKTDRVLTLHQL